MAFAAEIRKAEKKLRLDSLERSSKADQKKIDLDLECAEEVLPYDTNALPADADPHATTVRAVVHEDTQVNLGTGAGVLPMGSCDL